MRFSYLISCLVPALLLGAVNVSHAADKKAKPVLLYSRYFNAEGEDRYLPEGNYKAFLEKLSSTFKVVVHNQQLSQEILKGIDVVLIANPSDKPAKEHSAPHHFSSKDIVALNAFVLR